MTRTSSILSKLAVLIYTICVLTITEAQIPEKYTQNPCVSKRNCHECIQTQKCAWCMQPDFGEKPRCFQPSYVPLNYCTETFTYNPGNEFKNITVRELTRSGASASASGGGQMGYGSSYEASSSFSSSSSSSFSSQYGASSSGSGSSSSGFRASSGSIVQISPQRVNLKLRLNEPYSMHFSYSQAQDYPVDLYYLMDLSKSMEDDKEKLSKLGDLLSDTMKKTTSNFKLGFGSFVDKVLMPYVSTIPKNLLEPCEGCAAPYGYRNVMALSMDTYKFSEEVKRAAVSGNLDAPEGGFDAIMQAIVCRDQIGWRDQARRLLVFSTDAGFHYAGDGKLGGVIEPNDGRCHLDMNGLYTHSTVQDYPSISQINHHVVKNSINIIFAVTKEQINVYKKLSENIEGSSSAILSYDSSNVVDLVREEYNKISSSIEMKDNSSSDIKITYYSACLNGSTPIETAKCDGLKVGDIVQFSAEITLTKCPADPKDWHQQVQIYPVGINESLTIDLEMLCGCPCEKPGHPLYEVFSEKCNNFGTYMCGICECEEAHFGRNCECSTSEVHSNIERDFGCKANGSQIDCSGRGTCVCGVCECDKRPNPEEVVSGKYCDCDNFSCDRHNQLLCSGPDHGTCDCGVCRCRPGWTGSACDCWASNDTCIAPNGNGSICSGHGDCECGTCKCHVTKNEGRYSGKYCEKCPTCSGKCPELKDCVECQMYNSGPLKDPNECIANCSFVPIQVEKLEVDEEKEVKCTFYDDDDCKYVFKYTDNEDKPLVYAQKDRECPPKVFMLGIVLGVIAAIVLVGLAVLLLWKLLTTIHDRREFARFEKERMNAKWDTGENPIYKQATSTFKNPTYAGK